LFIENNLRKWKWLNAIICFNVVFALYVLALWLPSFMFFLYSHVILDTSKTPWCGCFGVYYQFGSYCLCVSRCFGGGVYSCLYFWCTSLFFHVVAASLCWQWVFCCAFPYRGSRGPFLVGPWYFVAMVSFGSVFVGFIGFVCIYIQNICMLSLSLSNLCVLHRFAFINLAISKRKCKYLF
jgi:hypothetical protein